MQKSKVIIRSIKERDIYTIVEEIFQVCGMHQKIKQGSTVVLKPNITIAVKDKAPAADTLPELVASVCRVLKQYTNNIIVGESDSNRYPAELGFQVIGLDRIARDLEIKLVNFSRSATHPVNPPLLRGFELPTAILDADVFITLPKLKTHALTYFTGALKNQWGCIPRYDRILLHKYLDQLLVDINAILKPQLAIMDGIIGMDQRGPTNGRPRQLDLILASTDCVALDATAMRLVGLEPNNARHVVMAYKAGLGSFYPEDIEIDGDFENHKTQFEPAHLDWAVAFMNYMTRYRFFTYHILLNDSIFYPVKRVIEVLRTIGVVR
jgi:uncharacterized protein (DUF362 family)